MQTDTSTPADPVLKDEEIALRAAVAENGEEFQRLYGEGDLTGYRSASDAELALCCQLALWTWDPSQIDRLFRTGELYRPERWDQRAQGQLSHGDRTIARALEIVQEYHRGPDGNRIAGHPILSVRPALSDAELPRFPLSDAGNAERLATSFENHLHFLSESEHWVLWNGTRWGEDRFGMMEKLAVNEARRLVEEGEKRLDMANAMEQNASTVSEKNRAKTMRYQAIGLIQWGRQSEGRNRITNTLKLGATSVGGLHVPVSAANLDQDPWLLNLLNGTLDLRTGILRQHDSGDLITKLAPVEHDPTATAPRWAKFLEEIFAGDRELIRYLQRALGYSLCGSVREEVLFYLYGRGQNGKTKFLEAVRSVMGDYAKTTDFTTFLTSRADGRPRNDIARLAGARLVTAVEPDRGARLSESTIKQLTGGDRTTARFLYREFFEFDPVFKLWLAGNYMPTIRGTDLGIWRRIQMIPFKVTIPEEKRDRGLLDKLKRESSGILNWVLKGLEMWCEQGLNPPAVVREATAEYREDMDPLADFLHQCCEPNDGAATSVSGLYCSYREWAARNGVRDPMSMKAFANALAEKGFDKNRATRGPDKGRVVVKGLRLL